ncbi:hypothetical protein PTI98_012935 [Pleurotus ostreatus]|nr:hypothetical protein PTI98_012935 [Pleurotus ostreatus]
MLAPSTPRYVSAGGDILVRYVQCDDGVSHAGVIARWNDVEALARNVEYQDGTAHLEIERELAFVTSKARFIVIKKFEYEEARFFKLSVVIENIHWDDWKKLREYQQERENLVDFIVNHVPCAWRGSEHIIKQIPKSPWQNDRSDVTNDIRHAAHESFPLAFKYANAQNEAIKQGLFPDDFQWEFPNHHEMRVVRSPSAQTDTPLRALRLDVHLYSSIMPLEEVAGVYIRSIDLMITPITRSPSLPNNLSSCNLRLDAPYAALATATIPDSSFQILDISTTSRLAELGITTSGSVATLNVNLVQITAPVAGDVFAAPIYGGNNGGRHNTNSIAVPRNPPPASRTDTGYLFSPLSFQAGLYQATNLRRVWPLLNREAKEWQRTQERSIMLHNCAID